jgi:hypothetical protein
MENVGEFGLNSTHEPSQDGKCVLSGLGVRLSICIPAAALACCESLILTPAKPQRP